VLQQIAMLLKPEEKNIITGILATVLIHLIFIIIFLVLQFNVMQTKKEEQVIIEFDEEVYKMLKESMNENKNVESEVQPLSQEEIRNIAVNTAEHLEEEISTDKYISDLKNELGIKDPVGPEEKAEGEEPIMETEKKEDKPIEKKVEKVYRGPSILNYSLEGRNKIYMPVPAFKCRGAGIITIGIIVNQKGEVLSAIIESTTSDEECISETAIEAAKASIFNNNVNAEPKQKGSITYQFLAQ
jgi:hypothetical protein